MPKAKGWVRVIDESGEDYLYTASMFEPVIVSEGAVKGRGHRSSCLGHQVRLIYKIVKGEVLVMVIDITAHDYKRT